MIVVFDASVLIFFLDENAKAPIDSETGQPVTYCKERIDYLIAALQHAKAKIIIPTPSLGEVLVKARTAAPDWLRILNSSRQFRVAPFDERAAVEFAAIQAARWATRTKTRTATHAKAKFDDQIVAIAAIEAAQVIYSDDDDIRRLAGSRFEVKGISSLPLPPRDAQMRLEFEPEPKIETENDIEDDSD